MAVDFFYYFILSSFCVYRFTLSIQGGIKLLTMLTATHIVSSPFDAIVYDTYT